MVTERTIQCPFLLSSSTCGGSVCKPPTEPVQCRSGYSSGSASQVSNLLAVPVKLLKGAGSPSFTEFIRNASSLSIFDNQRRQSHAEHVDESRGCSCCQRCFKNTNQALYSIRTPRTCPILILRTSEPCFLRPPRVINLPLHWTWALRLMGD